MNLKKLFLNKSVFIYLFVSSLVSAILVYADYLTSPTITALANKEFTPFVKYTVIALGAYFFWECISLLFSCS